MAVVVLDKLTKIYDRGHAPAADAVSLEIADGEFMVLLGPSGCGKTTTLRMVAGLESISSGTLTIDGRTMNGVPAKDRDIAMVFQSYALYPHMTVKDNLAFGLKRRGFARTEIERRVTAAAASLGLSELLGRRPHALSGGQRQRVALGRAIVRDPKVFLFDEPLSNLDAGLRATTRGEIAQLHRRLGATMIYVTHDQIEAMTLGTRICIMNGGRIEQVGQPLEVYRRPESTFVAGFLGNPPMNLLPASATGEDDGRTLAIGDQRITLPASVCPQSAAGRRIVFGIRPEHIRAEPQPATATGLPTIRAKAVRVEPLGAETIVAAEIPGIAKQLLVRLPGDAAVHASTTMTFVIDAANSHLFDEDGRVMRT